MEGIHIRIHIEGIRLRIHLAGIGLPNTQNECFDEYLNPALFFFSEIQTNQ